MRRIPLVLLFVAAVGFAALAASQRAQLNDERSERRSVERVAGELATALLTYDHSRLDESKARVLQNATGKFRKEYEDTFERALRPLFTETKATSEATVTDVFVGEIDDGTATAIVVADQKAQGVAGSRAAFASYILLDLVKAGGRWRVDGVTDLNFGQQAGTTTTAPG